jgi:hypothetical protein
MIDEYSTNGTGWARFSDDKLRRYRLARSLTTLPLTVDGTNGYVMTLGGSPARRVVFAMLNPSRADAFRLDNTVARCVKFAQLWGADVLEVVNLFAHRSPYPDDLKTVLDRGAGKENDEAILEACRGASRVIAAWGKGGEMWGRADAVRVLLADAGVRLEHLGLTNDGRPKHPLARGKHFIPYTMEPQPWA